MKRLLAAALALTALSVPAMASADDDHRGGRGHDRYDRRHDYDDRDDRRDERRAYRRGYREGRWADDRRHYDRPRYDRPYVHVQPRPYHGRPVPRYRTWNRGQVLPHDYRRYVVYDPYRYGLYAPPRGHAWMHVGNDVYLTALASGLIVEVLRDSYY